MTDVVTRIVEQVHDRYAEVNDGALAMAGMLPEDGRGSRFPFILDAFSRLAGRALAWDEEVDTSESATGHRNRAIAHLRRRAEVRRVDHLADSRMIGQLVTGLAERLRETTREVASLRS